MASKQLPIGVKHPLVRALASGEAKLDRKTRKMLEPILIEMALHIKEAEAAQDAVSAVHLYTLWKSDQTLTLTELLKAMRSPLAPDEELDMLHDALRQRYLEAMAQIADRRVQRILASSGK